MQPIPTNSTQIDKLRIPPEHDRRRKISETTRKDILDYYASCRSLRATAMRFHVARHTIRRIVDPTYVAKYKAANYKRADTPTSSKKRRLLKQTTRAYKIELIKRGILKP